MYSFHAIDMFALFGWLPQSRTPGHKLLYNVTEDDNEWTQMLRSRLVDEFAHTGQISSPWTPYRSPARRLESDSDSARHVIDFNVKNEHVIENLRHSQCSLFLNQQFYNTKVWIN